ncbi:MAG: hypothetical protein K8S98_02990 [Planctomycetes bacterium]|nr:hypothetical protein [Planctomycetota bacterium]
MGKLSHFGAACAAVVLSMSAPIAPAAPVASGRSGDGPLEALSRDLTARHPKSRRGAVRALAEIGGLEAWRLVAAALDDPESEVADEAQLRLAGVVDGRAVDELLGARGLDSKSENVRVRVAEALGRMVGPIDARELARAIGSRDGEVTRYAMWSVERLAARSLLGGERTTLVSKVESLARSASDAGTRAAALCALAELDRTRALAACASASDARAAEVRCAALVVGMRAPDTAARARLHELAADPSVGVRCQAVLALEAAADRAAVGDLVELLAREPRLRVADRATSALQRLSGLKHRRDARPWRDWLAQLPEDWHPTPARAPSEADGMTTRAAADFAGLSILSDRLAFLVDFSGSMWHPRDDGRSVKAVVDQRLAVGLEALGADARFNLIPFANDPVPWESALVDAKPAQKRRALEFFIGCRKQGRGNLYAAVRTALEDPEVDTLMVWSDGVPTGGFHSNLELVVPLLLEKNRFRNVAFDLILVDAPSGSARRLQELARRSGGRALSTSLDELASVSGKGG